MNKLKKVFLIVAILVAAGFLLWGTVWLFQYYQYRTSPEYKAQKYLDEMEKKYREDTYGGSTPEETLQLFIAALKKGDTDLASKYFVIDKQEEWKGKLEKVKNNSELENMIRDLEKAKRGNNISSQSSLFSVTNEKNEVITMINIILNPFTNKWKISDL